VQQVDIEFCVCDTFAFECDFKSTMLLPYTCFRIVNIYIYIDIDIESLHTTQHNVGLISPQKLLILT
jgi:hypothetical protein